MSKLSFIERYDLCIEPWRRGFASKYRPMPPNMHYVKTFVPGYYDFALLHLDQQSIYRPEDGERISKGRLFQELKKVIKDKEPDLPIVVINHHTPHHDKYKTHDVVKIIKDMTEGCIMVVNSYEAAKQWGWGETITHGLHPEEWGFDVPHFHRTGEMVMPVREPRCVIVLSPAGMETAYRREFARATVRRLEEYGVPTVWVGVTRKFDSFDSYRDFLARSLVFFFPAWQSPRPRSRTEACLSSNCIVTTPYHDANQMYRSGGLKQKREGDKIVEEKLIYDDDTNAFFTRFLDKSDAPNGMEMKDTGGDPRSMDNPEYSADLIRHLVFDEPDVALEMGKRARKLAIAEYNHDQFEKQWKEFLIKHKIFKELL